MDKTGWTKVKLGDIVNIQRGKRLTKKELSEVKNEDTPYKVIHGGIKPLGYYGQYNRKGNVCIVINTGNAGDVHYIDEDFWSSDACYCLYADDKKALNKFIYYQVLANEQYLHSQVRKSAMPTISADPISRLEVYLPDLETQQEIVKLLSTIDNIIQSKLDESTKYQNMKTQLMNDIFNNGEREYRDTWRTVKLGDICKIKCGKIPAKSSVEDGKYPLFVAGGTDGKYNSYSYDCEAILTSRNGDVGLAKYYNGKFEVSDHTFAITGFDNKEYDAKFIYYWMELNYDLIHGLAHGTGIPGVNTKDLSGLVIQVPSLSEQHHISSLLSQYDMIIEAEREHFSA